MPVSPSPGTLERTPCCAGADEVASVRLYSVPAVGLATLLGSPLAGAFVMQHNFKVLGRGNQLLRLWSLAIGLFVATFSLSSWHPETFSAQLLIVPEVLVMLVYARFCFSGSAGWQAHGRYSNWRVLGIWLLLLLVILTTIIELTLLLSLF
ncbi:hypothetical protein [Pseudomonas sp. S9]|uniref:hypothetical protein n=1 Tax=Pseudomonas sp. S9 TaxID=686578 RepID=UPI001110974B|nr:hypothetical protein [Pseudomonas sp. S9]